VTLYLDASAWLKLYLGEPGTGAVFDAMAEADTIASCRHAQAEVLAALLRAGAGGPVLADFDDLWSAVDSVEIDALLCESAAKLAARHGLGTLDALHLAAARTIPGAATLATWDRRLWDAAQAEGLKLLPARRP